MNWQLNHIEGICEDDQKQKFTCLETYSFFTSSLIWGTIGPSRLYGQDGLYHSSLFGFLFGALLPVPFYMLSRWGYPQFRHVYTPVLLTGGLVWAPYNLSWLIPSVIIGYIFQIYVKRKHFQWWSSYNVPSTSSDNGF